ncbi:hypothetical protein ACVCAH_35440 [Micromonospora sp. LZ34]
MFEQSQPTAVIAVHLRVTAMSVRDWRRMMGCRWGGSVGLVGNRRRGLPTLR